jgi:hypothetical protein
MELFCDSHIWCFLLCFLFFLLFISVLLTPSSLFSYPSSHPLHFPYIPCTTFCCSPSQLLFLPLFIHSFPCLYLPLLSLTIPPSYTLTICWIAYCTKRTQPQPPAILDTNTSTITTEKCSNTLKGHKNQHPSLHLNLPTPFLTPLLVPLLPIPQNL